MEPHAHLPILRRVGVVLVIVGLLDVAVMVVCIVGGIAYSSSLNIGAVVGGVLLMRGSLAAASHARWLSAIIPACICTAALAWPAVYPIDLTLTQARLSPAWTAASAVYLSGSVWLGIWIHGQLNQPPVLAAFEEAGRKVRSTWALAAYGAGLVVLFMAIDQFQLGGESATKAVSMARGQLGADYSYHVTALSVSTDAKGTFVFAQATAWNHREVRVVPLEWSE